MLTNYKEHGFHVSAEIFPEACTACPFWLYSVETDTGMCGVTGTEIKANGTHDEKRMDDCPIEEWKG